MSAIHSKPLLRRKISFERKLFAAFTTVIIFIVVIGLLSQFYRNKLLYTFKMVEHTHKVLGQSEQVLSITDDITNGARGFLMTGDSTYLRNFTLAKNTVLSHLIMLKTLTKDNPGQQIRIDSLSILLGRRIAYAEQYIRLSNTKSFDRAEDLITTRMGEIYSDKISRVIEAIQLEENNLLVIRRKENDKSIKAVNIVFYVFMCSLLILFVIILLAIKKNNATRKKDEETIRFKAELLNTIGQAVIATNMDGIINFWNKAAEEIYGWATAEAIGKNINEITPTHQSKEQANEIMQQLRQGHTWSGDLIVQCKDGFTFPVFVTDSPVYDQHHKLSGIIGVSFDITERKKNEAALLEAYEEKNTVLQRIDDGFFAVDKNSFITYWNTRAEILMNTKKEDIIGKNIHEVFGGTPSNAFYINYQKAISENCTIHFEEFSKLTNKWFAVSAFGSDNGLSVYFKDITERRKAEAELKESEKQLSIASKLAKLGYWEFDVVNNLFTFNDQFYSIFKTTAEKAGGYIMTPERYTELFVYPDDKNVVGIEVEKALNSSDSRFNSRVEHRIIYGDGKIGWISVNFYIVKNKAGQTFKTFGVNQDITEKKRAERQAELNRINQAALINNTADLMWSVDTNCRIIDFNQPFFDLVKSVSGKEVAKGDDIFSFILSSDQHARFTTIYARALSGDIFTEIEHISTPVVSWSEISYYPIRKGAEIIGTACYSRDITERKRAEISLQQSEKRFRRIVETAQEGIWMIDENNKTTFVNKKMCELLEYNEGEMMGRSNLVFKDAEEQKMALQQTERRRKGLDEINEARFITKSGRNIWVLASTNAILDDDGNYKGALAMMTDITNRKDWEDKIKESEAKYRSFFEYSTDGILLATKEGKMLAANPAACLIFRMTEAEICQGGRWELADIADPLARKFVQERARRGKATGTVTLLRKGNEKFQAEVSASVFTDADGEQKTSLIVRDITDRKAMEDLLDKANRLACIGSWEIDMVKETVYFSDITKEIHEVEPDFIPALQTGINFYKEGENRNRITAVIQDAIEQGKPWDVELQIITAKGNEKWIRTIGETEFTNGKALKIKGAFQDITARKISDIQVYELNENLQKQAEELAYQNKEKEKRAAELLIANRKLLFENDEKENRAAELVIANKELAFQNDEKEKRAAELVIANKELAFQNEEKEKRAAELVIANKELAFQNDEKEMRAAELGELNNDLQNQTKELAISNAELEQFAYVASHDLQEPLRMVTGFLTQLEKKYGNIIDEKGKQYIWFAVDGAKRMRQIILDLLEFSRVGRTEELPEDIDLNELVSEIQILFRKKIEDKKAIIIVDKLPKVHAHRSPMHQVFQNLIGNALKYSKKDTPGKIQITASETETHWQFAVSDNGIGIEAQYFDKIFIIFQRLHTKDEYPGTGMGLAVTKKIIENLGGKIHVESAMGNGSTFFFTIKK